MLMALTREISATFQACELTHLPRVPIAIGVAGGPSKVGPVLGALRAGIMNTLVTDVRTAEGVLALDDETRR